MKKQLFCTIFFVLLISVCFGQKPYKVVFYNLENFFDTINDPEVKDDEFTPEGPKKWNTAKYNKKLGNIERVLFGMAAIDKEYPIVIGVSEVENRNVLEMLESMREQYGAGINAELTPSGNHGTTRVFIGKAR